MMTRPKLAISISVEDFRDYYWLKEELLDFCRQNELPSSGPKQEVSERIEHYLRTGKILPTRLRSSKGRSSMPETFTRQTVIGSGWHCSQKLRTFFEAEVGQNFHFNRVMREFIKLEEGKTLQNAIDAWQEAKDNPPQKIEIETQFEYMRHMRKYFNKNPKATREDALRVWHEIKFQRKSSR